MFQRATKDLQLEIRPRKNRSAETLIPIIKKNVADGSTIITDEWQAYSFLARILCAPD
ncbi:hypothetical protein X975_23757, partial [Stegodyphus mimosarum]